MIKGIKLLYDSYRLRIKAGLFIVTDISACYTFGVITKINKDTLIFDIMILHFIALTIILVALYISHILKGCIILSKMIDNYSELCKEGIDTLEKYCDYCIGNYEYNMFIPSNYWEKHMEPIINQYPKTSNTKELYFKLHDKFGYHPDCGEDDF